MLGLTTRRRLRAAEAHAHATARLLQDAQAELEHVAAQRDETLQLAEQAFVELIREQRRFDRDIHRLRRRLTRSVQSLAYWRGQEAAQRRGTARARGEVRLLASRLLESGGRPGGPLAADGADGDV